MLAIFDFDGTIVKETVFQVIRNYLVDKVYKNPDDKERVVFQNAYGAYKILMKRSNSEKMAMRLLRDLDLILYKTAKYNIKSDAPNIARNLTLIEGVKNFIQNLYEKSYKIFIVSQAQYDVIKEFLKINNINCFIKDVYATNLIVDEEGHVVDFFCYPVNSNIEWDIFNLGMSKYRVIKNIQEECSKTDGVEYNRENTILITDYESEIVELRKLLKVYLYKTNHPKFEEIKEKVDIVFNEFDELYDKI